MSVVGAMGFEPMTSCSQSKRATKLRNAPKKAGIIGRQNDYSRKARKRKTQSTMNSISFFPSKLSRTTFAGVGTFTFLERT